MSIGNFGPLHQLQTCANFPIGSYLTCLDFQSEIFRYVAPQNPSQNRTNHRPRLLPPAVLILLPPAPRKLGPFHLAHGHLPTETSTTTTHPGKERKVLPPPLPSKSEWSIPERAYSCLTLANSIRSAGFLGTRSVVDPAFPERGAVLPSSRLPGAVFLCHVVTRRLPRVVEVDAGVQAVVPFEGVVHIGQHVDRGV